MTTTFDKYRQIGRLLYEQGTLEMSDMIFPTECASITVGLSCHSVDNAIDISQQCHNGISKEINNAQLPVTLYPSLDRDIAYRIAGLLVAWADSGALHERKPEKALQKLQEMEGLDE